MAKEKTDLTLNDGWIPLISAEKSCSSTLDEILEGFRLTPLFFFNHHERQHDITLSTHEAINLHLLITSFTIITQNQLEKGT